MLNIRINVNVDLKKVAVVLTTFFLFWGSLLTPANASDFKAEFDFVPEKSVTVHLQYETITVTRSQAKAALNSPYAQYYDVQTLAFLTEYSKGVSMAEWSCLNNIWTNESHFNPKALNKGSKAFGVAQFLPSTWGNYKVQKTSVAALQIKYGLQYIQSRYGDPCNAWKFWKAHQWY